MEPKSIKSDPWDPLGALRAPLERGVVIRTPFLSISTHFWGPSGIPFSQLLDTSLERFFHHFPQHSQYLILLFFASLLGVLDTLLVLFGDTCN